MADLKMDFEKMAKSFTKTAKEKGMFVGWWIPVTERLPKRYELVLVTDKFGLVDTARFIHDDLMENDEWKVTNDETIDVIAWMPLPQPYKAESEVSDAYSD